MPNVIYGVPIDSNRFIGKTDLNELVSAGLLRPSSTAADVKGSSDTARGGFKLRAEIQRRFDKSRSERAMAYARYIVGVQNKSIAGGVPPINLYISGYPQIDNGVLTLTRLPMCVIDGETQTEARFIIAETCPDSFTWDFPVVVWHSYDDDSVARQYLVDCNLHANPISSKTAMGMDQTGRLTTAVRNAVEMAGLDQSDINTASDLPGTRKKISLRQCTAAATGYALNGHTYGRSYADVVMELNNPYPSSPVYEFNANEITGGTAQIIAAVLAAGVAQNASPMVMMAAGVKARQGHDVRTLNFKRACEQKFSGAGSVDKKIAVLKNVL
jgi:hypothetical protein